MKKWKSRTGYFETRAWRVWGVEALADLGNVGDEEAY